MIILWTSLIYFFHGNKNLVVDLISASVHFSHIFRFRLQRAPKRYTPSRTASGGLYRHGFNTLLLPEIRSPPPTQLPWSSEIRLCHLSRHRRQRTTNWQDILFLCVLCPRSRWVIEENSKANPKENPSPWFFIPSRNKSTLETKGIELHTHRTDLGEDGVKWIIFSLSWKYRVS